MLFFVHLCVLFFVGPNAVVVVLSSSSLSLLFF